MRILYAVGSWGLGHATRSLPLISALMERHAGLTVISTGRALAVLRAELQDRCEFLDWPDVPHTVGRTAWGFYLKTAAAIPRYLAVVRTEQQRTADLLRHRRFDRIVSDNRYGIQHPDVPSFHVVHGLRFIAPGRVQVIERRLETENYRWLGHLRQIIVPDTQEDRLSGDLAHRLDVFPPRVVTYAGILSRLRRQVVEEDLDLFITLSGPEPQRTMVEEVVMRQLPSIPGRIVVTLGTPDRTARTRVGTADVYGYLDRPAQEEMMNRARLVLCRSGYSTIMDLAELQRRAVLIPTPGQTEQMYLAGYHQARGTTVSFDQRRLDLRAAMAHGAGLPPFRASTSTADTVRRATGLILAG